MLRTYFSGEAGADFELWLSFTELTRSGSFMAVDRIVPIIDPANTHWRERLPTLRGTRVTARELRSSDSAVLHAIATNPDVARFSWPPPPNPEAVKRFIAWTRAERRAGRYLGFGLVCRRTGELAGFCELRRLQPDFFRAETGFFLDSRCWGQGLFDEAARLVYGFAFDVVGASRIEARTSVENFRGNAALAKAGFRHEGVLRDAFVHEGRYTDQNLWAISRRR
jgi:ribosomal-protein-alanine N-acetyltransferase